MRLTPFVLIALFMSSMFGVRAHAESTPDWSVGVFGELSNPSISFDDLDLDASSFSYNGNIEFEPAFSLRYKHYSLSLGTPLTGHSQDKQDRPPTRFFDLRLAWLDAKWGVETYAQYYRGFFVTRYSDDSFMFDNSAASLVSWNANLYRAIGSWSRIDRMRDGLATTGLRVNFYSLLGVSSQSFRSPFPVLDSLPEGHGAPYEFMTRLSHSSMFTGLGTTVNTNLFGFYLDPTILLGLGVQHRKADVQIDPVGVLFKGHIKVQMGYATKNWNYGFVVSDDVNSVDFDDRYGVMFHALVIKYFVMRSF